MELTKLGRPFAMSVTVGERGVPLGYLKKTVYLNYEMSLCACVW